MNVLSNFDGISCGQVALERAGIKVDNYYASEVDKYAIQITQKNYPDTIQLGDITQIKGSDLPEIDLMIGGSPCQGFSFAGKQLNFDDPRSALFFEYVRLLEECKPKYFLLENVKMKKEYQEVISGLLGVEPVEINSALVSAQQRKRLYWTNIPSMGQPEDREIMLKDIIGSGVVDRSKSYCIDANYYKGGNLKSYFEKSRRQLVFESNVVGFGAAIRGRYNKDKTISQNLECNFTEKSNTLTTAQKDTIVVFKTNQINPSKRANGVQPYMQDRVFHLKGKCHAITAAFASRTNIGDFDVDTWRSLTCVECERLQTLEDNYTEGVSNTQRYKALGNGWTVDVIVHILGGINV